MPRQVDGDLRVRESLLALQIGAQLQRQPRPLLQRIVEHIARLMPGHSDDDRHADQPADDARARRRTEQAAAQECSPAKAVPPWAAPS